MTDFDVVVIGAGPAGLAFTRALAGAGLRIALVDRQPRATLADPPVDGREIALTHRSVATLEKLGAWGRIDPADIAPLRRARVLNGGSGFALNFDAEGSRDEPLGWLVPNHRIRRALYEATENQRGVEFLPGAAVASVRAAPTSARVALEDGRVLGARLIVAADSRFSATRDALGISARMNRLGRSMLVCRVAHEEDHGGVATEWFDHHQTIAMLPLNRRQSSAVLTLSSGAIDRLAALDPVRLGMEITRRYQARLGAMTLVGEPHVYPLVTSWADRFVTTRAALIGDAAIGMHPVTAHGFNLGLMGAARLAGLIAGAAARGGDIAAPALLARHETSHRMAGRPIYMATNMLVGLYTAERPPARLVRHVALRAAARAPFVRRAVGHMLAQR